MKVDLLNKLCDLLDTQLVREHFYMGSWVSRAVVDEPVSELAFNNTCFTAACVAGWATTIPETGLRLAETFSIGPKISHPETNTSNYRAFAKAFELTRSESESICSPFGYTARPSQDITPDMAIARIREVIAEHERVVPA